MDDIISRRVAIDALRTCYDTEVITYTNGKEYIDYDQALDLMENLPPVQPEREKGRWIPVSCRRSLGESGILISEYVEESDPYDVVAVKCSKCGTVFDFDDARYYCSQCGAYMWGDKQC